ncbi:GlxA family transcriptional regulator [Shimia sp. R9_3]|uniref:GlxA family transcriptional regulator n=1 Tax=Shimia sp. R9_3 TaxID=2821113 RepID=UPI001ADD18D3|nr:GlxA family transcriptional regulator [Shimia sp. R9_3]MBO9403368.1 GlxA family transcriptional regulator [Shimia sp. R9_3]
MMRGPEIRVSNSNIKPSARAKFVFLISPGFSALELGAGVDALAAANAVAEHPVFDWTIVSETGGPVTSSSGIKVEVEGSLPHTSRGDCIVICGAAGVAQIVSNELKSWLRQARRFGVQLCGIGGGATILASAGLATGQRLSAHWQHQPAFVELFPEIESVCSIYETERGITTCGGGASTIDLFASIINQQCGQDTVTKVADHLLYASVRVKDDRQTQTDLCRFGTRHEKLARAVELMQKNLEAPLSPSAVAANAGLSTRQLERLFQKYVGMSPKTYMTSLRLERARTLLQQTDMRVLDVAISCGFASASHFSKCFRQHFGISPHTQKRAG